MCENQVCAVVSVRHIGMQLTIYCVTGIGLLKRIRCDSMLLVYASRCLQRRGHDGVNTAYICENQVCAVISVRHIGMQLTIYCLTGIGLLKRARRCGCCVYMRESGMCCVFYASTRHAANDLLCDRHQSAQESMTVWMLRVYARIRYVLWYLCVTSACS